MSSFINTLILCLGMRNSGGHGGGSASEVKVPLVFLAPMSTQSNDTYNQIDLPATLAILFGLPIPASSIGVIIPNLIAGLSMQEKLFAYHYNGQRLLQKLINLNGLHVVETEGKYDFYTLNELFRQIINSFLKYWL